MRKFKRVLVISDFHCGHELGLTPSKWNPDYADDHSGKYRDYMWTTFINTVRELQPIDILVANGDLIDGRGERSASLELIVLDRSHQAMMAAEVINSCDAKKKFITRGTDYHVGDAESWEDLVSERVGAERVGDIINIDINGLMFSFRHHIGGSQTPIGRSTPLTREAVWNALWSVRQGFPQADVMIRSHVHYHAFTGGPGWLAMTTPGLQGYGTRFGERRMSGLIDFGLIYFDITSRDDFEWHSICWPFPIPEPVRA